MSSHHSNKYGRSEFTNSIYNAILRFYSVDVTLEYPGDNIDTR